MTESYVHTFCESGPEVYFEPRENARCCAGVLRIDTPGFSHTFEGLTIADIERFGLAVLNAAEAARKLEANHYAAALVPAGPPPF